MHPTWTEQWWPVAYLQDLDPSRPSRFTLLERDLVIWWDAGGDSWRAFPDVCPHRLVPLSEGRINGAGQLECPYHGWSFDGEGHCRSIPQADAESKPEGVAPGVRACRPPLVKGCCLSGWELRMQPPPVLFPSSRRWRTP